MTPTDKRLTTVISTCGHYGTSRKRSNKHFRGVGKTRDGRTSVTVKMGKTRDGTVRDIYVTDP